MPATLPAVSASSEGSGGSLVLSFRIGLWAAPVTSEPGAGPMFDGIPGFGRRLEPQGNHQARLDREGPVLGCSDSTQVPHGLGRLTVVRLEITASRRLGDEQKSSALGPTALRPWRPPGPDGPGASGRQ